LQLQTGRDELGQIEVLVFLLGVGGLVDAQEMFSNAEIVDHLSDAEKRCDDDHSAQGTLQERRRPLLKMSQFLDQHPRKCLPPSKDWFVNMHIIYAFSF